MMNLKNIVPFIVAFLSLPVFSQTTGTEWPGKFFKGYSRSVTTGKFSYHSPQPDVTTSLLLRSIDSASFISWETERIPENFSERNAYFIWMFGIDANPESHKYRLYVNGEYCLTFANPTVPELKTWSVTGLKGSMLTFRTTMLDKYDDPMGYALFKLPLELMKPGQAQVIKVVGESAGSNVWYMTFESAVEEKTDIVQEEAVIKENGRKFYSILFNFVHLGKPVTGTLRINTVKNLDIRLEPGFNQYQVLVPWSEDTLTYRARVDLGKKEPVSRTFKVRPVRPWVIYLVQHTHTDIGYTRPQTEILPEHLRYIDYALDYCDQTDSLPDDARFRWTCETSWAVREYLNTRPRSQVERLKKRISEGRIEVTGLFLNSSDLSDEASVASSLQPVKEFRDAGIPVRSAMQDDINGVPWCLVDYLSGCGINFLSMGQNDSRALKPFDRPTTFWWESPSGSRILVNRPEHYMWGNQLGILTNIETFARSLFLHLKDITGKGYPYDHYAIQFSGYLTDNSPPSTTACGIVKQWNEKYLWPELRLATIGEFGKYLQDNPPSGMPMIRGAWPDWWMDGFGSAPIETAYARMAHEDFIANQEFAAMAVIMGINLPAVFPSKLAEIAGDIAFYDEHTFGAAESISDPLAENTVVQWGEKAAYAWDAVKKNRILREELMGIVQPYLPKSKRPVITVFNTLNWPRSATVTLFIDHQVIPKGRSFRIVDDLGRTVPVQAVAAREDGTYWSLYASDVPPLGFRTYRVIAGTLPVIIPGKKTFGGVLENRFYRVTVDPEKGTVKGIYDKELNRELTDPVAKYTTGQFIYERLGNNRHQLEVLKLDEVTRTLPGEISVSDVTEGPVWKSVRIHGQLKECADPGGISCEIRLYETEKKIGFFYSMKKLAVTDPEAVYVAFPFRLPNSHLVFEVQGGSVIPGIDQIEGSASDWDGIQDFVSVRNDESQVVWVSPEIPLVQLGDINLGKFSRVANPVSTSVFSWVLNNYWTTNFRAAEEGELKWSYFVTSSADPGNEAASKFGWGQRIPLLSRVFPGTNDSIPLPSRDRFGTAPVTSFIGGSLDHVLLVTAHPAADSGGIILQLRETAGKNVSVPVNDVLSSVLDLVSSTRSKSVYEVNVLGEVIRPVKERLAIKPYETRFIRIDF
jgi:alpha-mannosidase